LIKLLLILTAINYGNVCKLTLLMDDDDAFI